MANAATHSPHAATQPPTLTAREVTERLEVSKQTLRRWRAAGTLTGQQIGNETHYHTALINALATARNTH